MVGGSFTASTAIDETAVALLNAVVPPLTVVSADAPALPVVRSQARNVSPAAVPKKFPAGINRTRVVPSAARSRALFAAGDPKLIQLVPSVVNCHVPLLLSTSITAMPAR